MHVEEHGKQRERGLIRRNRIPPSQNIHTDVTRMRAAESLIAYHTRAQRAKVGVGCSGEAGCGG